MTEELPIQEDLVPASEPLATSGIPEADKKRVVIGSAIGGGIFLGVLIAIIVLVSAESKKSDPKPTPKPQQFPHFNPYFVFDFVRENDRVSKATLTNLRKELDQNKTYDIDLYGYTPIVVETYENREPEYLQAVVIEYDEHLTRMIYYDAQLPRWHVPYFGNHSDPYSQAAQYTQTPTGFHLYENVNNSFQWYFTSNSSGMTPLIDTIGCRLQYFDKYIEFEALLERDYIYGMGERIESFYLKNDNYSLWNRFVPSDHRSDTEIGMYGSHPFILNRRAINQPSAFLGLFMRNSNAMLFSMWDHANNGTTINYKIIGGVIDIYLFHSADPQYIIRKYHSVIGRPYLPPIWAMGLQQAREKYTVADFKKIIASHQEHHLPIDALWADTEMNVDRRTFTVNKNSFAGIKELVNDMHDHKKGYDLHFVVMLTPGIAKDPNYKYYKEALEGECLIQSTAKPLPEPYEGQTLAGVTVWLDFFVYNATLTWANGLHDLFEETLYDGVWILENEPFNQCNGECNLAATIADQEPNIPNPFHNKSEFSYIPYRPTLDPLESETLPMTAYHFGDDMFHKQYFTHNLYGIQSAQATYEALYGVFENKRFLMASRSTWPGSGRFGSHWLDRNFATWESMASSIPSVLNFNMFGIPHVGAPIGGFFFDAEDELLLRWFELAAFYPLMLSYAESSTKGKEAFQLTKYLPIILNTLQERYCLIRFMYTKMFEAFLWGGSVVHPVFFDFTTDNALYHRDILDRTFMWASTLYVIPSLIQHQAAVRAYLPNWRWVDLRTLEVVLEYSPYTTEGRYVEFEQPLGYITVLIKGGSIIPYQHLSREGKIENTKDLETIPTRLIVVPDHEGKAVGSMVVDAVGINPYPDPTSNTYRHYTFTYMNQIFRINKLGGFDFYDNFIYDQFEELLILENFGTMQVDFVCMIDIHMAKKELKFSKSMTSNMLSIHDEGMNRTPMSIVESIVWGSGEQCNFCRVQVYLEELKLDATARVMTGTLTTTGSGAYMVKYNFYASALNNHIAYMSIAKNEPGVTEWYVPDVISESFKRTPLATKTLDAVGFGVSHPQQPFFFEMSEEYDPQDFWLTSRSQPFVYTRNFIQVRFLVSARHVFGLGERVGRFELADGIYSVWNYDSMTEESGRLPGNNMYGSHPFYMLHAHNPLEFGGVFFYTSNPMDMKVTHIGMQTQLGHILSGGVLEMFFIGKGSAEEVVKQYQYIIGKPHPLPFWAFGFHQSRWGYKDIEHLRYVVQRFEEESIPLDGVWMDKDFMLRYKSFTIDSRNWHGLKQFVDELHAKNKHFVAIVDAGIAQDSTYNVYQRGIAANVFIKSNFTKEDLVGITWAGYSVWVDYLHPAATTFWDATLKEFYSLVNFDALWLDMNEPSNFCDGECPDHMSYHYYFFPLDYYDDLYYNPTHRPLEAKTISMEALHYGESKTATEFNYHSMYGYYQSKETSNFFLNTLKKRPFIISSSTFPGSGRYAAHWLGDNYSTWVDMQYSIAGMIHFGMFGIPFVGANICGYSGNATDQLCARWMQLGAYYPFMRNHNGPEGSPQEPYVNETIKIAAKHAIITRYSIARYIYTEYMHIVLRGGLLVKSLIFVYPDDNNTYTTVDTSFMLGPAIRVTPIMEESSDKVTSYFPNADWYTFVAPRYEKVMEFNKTAHFGKTIEVHNGIGADTSNVHLKERSIIPIQEAREGIQNILQLHNMSMNLLVVPNYLQEAHGEIFYDIEEHLRFKTEHQDIEMDMYHSQITFNTISGMELAAYNHTDMYIDKIIILGAEAYSKTTTAKFETITSQTVNMKTPVYDAANKILTLQAEGATSMNVLKLRKVYWND